MDTAWRLGFAVFFVLMFFGSIVVNLTRINRIKGNKFGWKEAVVHAYMSEYYNSFTYSSSWPVKKYVRYTEVEGEQVTSEDSRLSNGDKVYLIDIYDTHLPSAVTRFTLKRED